jgi:hypothetical protein
MAQTYNLFADFPSRISRMQQIVVACQEAAQAGAHCNPGPLEKYIGTLGDKINTILSGIGHNFRLLLHWIRNLFVFILILTKSLSSALQSWFCSPKMGFLTNDYVHL